MNKEFWKIHGKEVIKEMEKFREKIKKKKKTIPKVIKIKGWISKEEYEEKLCKLTII